MSDTKMIIIYVGDNVEDEYYQTYEIHDPRPYQRLEVIRSDGFFADDRKFIPPHCIRSIQLI